MVSLAGFHMFGDGFMFRLFLWMLAFGVATLTGAQAAYAELAVEHLRCEYLENPIGIGQTAPRLGWKVTSDQRNQRQTSYQILVATSPEKLNPREADLWDSGEVASGETTQIVYGGKRLTSRMPCFWRVRVWDQDGVRSPWSRPAHWSMGLLEPSDWTARWISYRDESPVHNSREELKLQPPRTYRKEFDAGKAIRRATIRATALGIVDLYLNGQRVSDVYFAPGWSDYKQRVYYRSFDVTELVREGENAMGAVVAEGWYSGYVGFGLLVGYGPNRVGRSFYGKTPALRAQLEIEYADGSRQTVATDRTWKVTDSGPEREADLLMGERYDARMELGDWASPGYEDAAWQGAILASENGSTTAMFHDKAGDREIELGFVEPELIQAYPGPPIEAIEEIRPVALTEPEPGVYIFDMGQNFSGVVRLTVQGAAGTEIRLRFGEMLHNDGRLMTENLRKARATDYYILRGDAEGETWTPRFTYHGFQFVELTGLPKKPALDAVTGVVIHSDTPLVSSFECSDPMVNQLFQNIVWTQRSNFLEVPTDCPQRDERLGWTGDAQIYVRAAAWNADVAAFFTKWEDDLVESQRENGAYPAYAPFTMQHGIRGKAYGSAWMDAGIICPYTIYKVYGDKRILKEHYASMKRFMDFRERESPDCRGKFIGNDWGDWLCVGEKTPIEFIDVCYFAYTTSLMSEIAAAVDKGDDANHYHGLFHRIQDSFFDDYVADDGSLSVRTQTAYALALSTGLIPRALWARVSSHLADLIEENDVSMTTGFLGTRPLLPVLSATGHHDLAVRLLQSRRYPSWGYEVENGATSIWERWNSYTKDDGFMNASMNSFSHYSFGAVCDWMFVSLAGIETQEPGFGRVRIQPGPPSPDSNPENEPIHWVKASYDGPRGLIESHWRRDGKTFTLDVTLPANTTGTIALPAIGVDSVTERGKPLADADGIKPRGTANGCVWLVVGSGRYRFQSTMN